MLSIFEFHVVHVFILQFRVHEREIFVDDFQSDKIMMYKHSGKQLNIVNKSNLFGLSAFQVKDLHKLLNRSTLHYKVTQKKYYILLKQSYFKHKQQ